MDFQTITEFKVNKGNHGLGYWLALGLAYLSEESVDLVPFTSLRTREAIFDRFEKDVEEARLSQQYEWEHHREWFLRYHPNTPETGPVAHPWGDHVVDICRCWLRAPAEVVFEVFTVSRKAAREATEEVLDRFALGDADAGRFVAEQTRKAVEAWFDRYAERAWAARFKAKAA